MNIKRYEWEDALIVAQKEHRISNAVLTTALKLSYVINWAPRKGKRVGINWKNDDAFEACGLARATAYRNRDALFAAGFMVLQGNNWEPRLPKSQSETIEPTEESQTETVDMDEKSHNETVEDPQESQNETFEEEQSKEKSQLETAKSQSETPESQLEHPFSVDSFTEDVFSEETTESTPGGASSLNVKTGDEDKIEEPSSNYEDDGDSLNFEDSPRSSHVVIEEPESQLETGHENCNHGRLWNEGCEAQRAKFASSEMEW